MTDSLLQDVSFTLLKVLFLLKAHFGKTLMGMNTGILNHTRGRRKATWFQKDCIMVESLLQKV